MTKSGKVLTGYASALTAGAAVGLALALAGCGGHNSQIQGRDYGSAKVLNEPNGWSNVAIKCDGFGHRVYVTDHGDSQSSGVAVINDPTCPGGAR